MEIVDRWIIEKTGRELESYRPVPLSPQAFGEILMPLRDIFQPNFERIKTVRYKPRAEDQADYAIEAFAYKPVAKTWDSITVNAWRVLFERFSQWLIVCGANVHEGTETLSFMPEGLARELQLPCLMLSSLHQMKLPLPIDNQARLELPNVSYDPSFLLH